VILVVAGVGVMIHSYRHGAAASTTGPAPAGGTTSSTTIPQGSKQGSGITLNLHAHSTTDPSSIWVVVNKKHPLRPLDFAPALTVVRGYQVAKAAAPDLEDLLEAGNAHGLGLHIASAYRSYAYQVAVHDSDVASHGGAAADRVSARPGYSEHQTGLAVDLITPDHSRCDFKACFAGTRAGRWLAGNSWRYGFIVRYTPGVQAITGYSPEPWHIRYIGRPLAAAMRHAHVATLEQVFHITGGGYPRG
jgi:zinc D-Ala-D-Ala carboxypeptidase